MPHSFCPVLLHTGNLDGPPLEFTLLLFTQVVFPNTLPGVSLETPVL